MVFQVHRAATSVCASPCATGVSSGRVAQMCLFQAQKRPAVLAGRIDQILYSCGSAFFQGLYLAAFWLVIQCQPFFEPYRYCGPFRTDDTVPCGIAILAFDHHMLAEYAFVCVPQSYGCTL